MKKRQQKPLRFVVHDPVYKSNCTFLVRTRFEEVEKEIKEKADAESIKDWDWGQHRGDNGVCFSFKLKEGASCFVVWVRDFSPFVEHQSILAHELVHLTFYVLENKGVPIRVKNDEAFAYLYEYYFKNVFTILAKRKEFIKKKVL